MDYYITCNGRILQGDETPNNMGTIRIHPRLVGGKGGFGSMLRAIGARIEKTTNHEACRDLNGRRMRDVNNEKKITEWLQEQDTKEKERVQKHNDRIERTLNPKMRYEDKDYTKSIQGNVDKVNEAVKIATTVNKNKPGEKRKTTEQVSNSKKSKMWLGLDELDSDEDSDALESDPEDGEITNKLAKEPKTDQQTKKQEESSGDPVTTAIESDKDKVPEEKKYVEKKEESSPKQNEEVQKKATGPEYLCLDEYKDAEELQSVGLERLKSALMFHGMKCGGTLQQRAQRLFLTKGKKSLKDLDPSLFVKKK